MISVNGDPLGVCKGGEREREKERGGERLRDREKDRDHDDQLRRPADRNEISEKLG